MWRQELNTCTPASCGLLPPVSLGTLRGHQKVILDCIHTGYTHTIELHIIPTLHSLPKLPPYSQWVRLFGFLSSFFFFFCTCLNPTNKDYLKFLIFQEKSSWNSQNPIGTEVFRVLKGITGPLLCGLIMLNVCPWAHRFLEPGGHWTHPLCLPQRGVCSGVSGLNSSINLTENLASVVGTFRRL